MTAAGWLDDQEFEAWTSWLRTSVQVTEALERELQEAFGRSLAEYEVLVNLSQATDRRRRMADLADRSLLSRSRLTHTVDRLERAGLVDREPCSDDRRGTWAVLTDHGRVSLETMAPVHVAGVRRHLFDGLEPDEIRALGAALGKVAARFDGEDLICP